MNTRRMQVLGILAGIFVLFAVIHLRSARAQQTDTDTPIVLALGNQISVYYPAQKRVYVYTELGGSCLYAYTLSTPGGRIARENCR